MIQEVHHRVKNNLQTIAAVLRMQARRAEEGSTQQALKEAITRILSVAVIHEFLSLDESQSINVRDVCQRIVAQTRQVLVPGQMIDFSVEGPAIYLPSQQATACALVINELIQNALEHGFEHRSRAQIRVTSDRWRRRGSSSKSATTASRCPLISSLAYADQPGAADRAQPGPGRPARAGDAGESAPAASSPP